MLEEYKQNSWDQVSFIELGPFNTSTTFTSHENCFLWSKHRTAELDKENRGSFHKTASTLTELVFKAILTIQVNGHTCPTIIHLYSCKKAQQKQIFEALNTLKQLKISFDFNSSDWSVHASAIFGIPMPPSPLPVPICKAPPSSTESFGRPWTTNHGAKTLLISPSISYHKKPNWSKPLCEERSDHCTQLHASAARPSKWLAEYIGRFYMLSSYWKSIMQISSWWPTNAIPRQFGEVQYIMYSTGYFQSLPESIVRTAFGQRFISRYQDPARASFSEVET